MFWLQLKFLTRKDFFDSEEGVYQYSVYNLEMDILRPIW